MLFSTLEIWFVRLALCFLAGNPINLFLYGSTGSQIILDTQGNFLEPAINMGIYSLSLLLMLLRWRKVLTQILKGNLAIWLVVIITVASTLWSDYPDLTWRRSIIVIGATLFGTYFATCFTFKQQIQALVWAFTVVALMSLALGLFLPRFGTMTVPPHTGSWRGVYIHKQGLGNQMGLFSAFFLALTHSDIFGKRKRWMYLRLMLGVFLTFASRSSTGVISLAVLSLVIYVCHSRKFGFSILSFVLVCLTAFTLGGTAFYLVDNMETVLGLFGKDMSVSGRDQLWPAVWEFIHRRPWWGYGYEAFWQGEYSNAGTIWQAVGWPAPHAHNGFLELLLAFGWVGTLVFLWTFGVNLLRSLYLIRIDRTSEFILPFVFLIQLVLSNMTEKNMLGGGLTWVMYIWIAFLPCYSRNWIALQALKRTYQTNLEQENKARLTAIPARSNLDKHSP